MKSIIYGTTTTALLMAPQAEISTKPDHRCIIPVNFSLYPPGHDKVISLDAIHALLTPEFVTTALRGADDPGHLVAFFVEHHFCETQHIGHGNSPAMIVHGP